jgi:hypothetical protein
VFFMATGEPSSGTVRFKGLFPELHRKNWVVWGRRAQCMKHCIDKPLGYVRGGQGETSTGSEGKQSTVQEQSSTKIRECSCEMGAKHARRKQKKAKR